jgi:iron complex transport system substrate-binding protein
VNAAVKQLAALHIKSYVEITPTDLAGAYKEMADLGALTQTSEGARTLITSMKSRITRIINSVKLVRPVTFYHELDNTYYSITSDTFIGKVYKDFGLTNIADAAAKADDGGYPQLQSEYIVKSNPTIIFLADGNVPDGNENYTSVKKRPGWSSLLGVKKNNVIALPTDIPSRWGPRLVNFYGFVAKSILRVESK